MEILVVGATGATGRLLVQDLLLRGQHVRAMVRAADKLPKVVREHGRLSLIRASVLDLSAVQMAQSVKGCGAVVSCLGHNLSWKGVFGQPRSLVTDATRRLCRAIASNKAKEPVRFILMNTAGNRNRDLNEPLSFVHQVVVAILRLLLPPHADNENAAEYLRTVIGQEETSVQWTAVRPDTLLDEDQVSDYKVYPSPIRSSIFNPGSASRINVAHFMADLITDDTVWNRWKGKMPVLYNKGSS